MDEALSGAPISLNPSNPVWRGLKDVAFGSVSVFTMTYLHVFFPCETYGYFHRRLA